MSEVSSAIEFQTNFCDIAIELTWNLLIVPFPQQMRNMLSIKFQVHVSSYIIPQMIETFIPTI